MRELPIVCSLDAAAREARRANLLSGLGARAARRDPIDEGYRFEFGAAASVLGAIAAAIEAERHCCRFLRFTVLVEEDGGPIRLDVTGPAGTRAFLDALIAGG